MDTQKSKFKLIFSMVLWGLFVVGLLTVLLVFKGISHGFIGYMPPIADLQNPKNSYATEIFSEDNVSLGRYYRTENRLGVPYSEISPYMVKALVATEDARFYEHSGIDPKAVLRALMTLGRAGGGSTLTQQLSKQLYSPRANNTFERLMQKPNEWVIAANLERLYSKEEILTMYLNQFDYLYNAVGIKSAAWVYFGTTPAELTIEQAAMLVGMCKNPSFYNPIRHYDRALPRRNTVLEQMKKYGYITKEECDSLKQTPLEVKYHSVDHKQGPAPYFREYLRNILTASEPKESNYSSWNKDQYPIDKARWENDPLYGWCNKNTKPDGSKYDIYKDGLRIYTTIDSRMQRYAEQAVDSQMRDLQSKFFKEKKNKTYAPYARTMSTEDVEASLKRAMKQSEHYRGLKKQGWSEEQIWEEFNKPVEMQVFSYNGMIDTVLSPIDSIRWQKYFLRCGFMSMDPHNGHVKAYVGGPNFTQFQYDMVNIGKRQVGSTVKPYLYTLAMSEGYCPCSKTVNRPITLITADGKEWSPRNGSKTHLGDSVTLQWGLQQSNNWISAYVMSCVQPEQFVELLHSFGIEGHLDPVVSLCLGPCEVSVREMVSAYTAFPNKGIRLEPLYVTRIEDANGNIISNFVPQAHEVVSEETSYKMIYMMRSVLDGGTGSRMRFKYGIHAPMGGKTGTTQNNSDGWFMCYTPSLVNGAWVGGEDRSIHFDNMSEGQGASMALPIVGLYMQQVYKDQSLGYSETEQFEIPAGFDPNAECR